MLVKLFVAGLVAFVPSGSGEVKAIFPDTTDWRDVAYPIPSHEPEIIFFEDDLDGQACADADVGGNPVPYLPGGCSVSIRGRELSLGTSGASPTSSYDHLGDIMQIGPVKAAEVRDELPASPGDHEFLAARAHIRFKTWETCGYVAQRSEHGSRDVYLWEFRGVKNTSAGEGTAARSLASSQLFTWEQPAQPWTIQLRNIEDGTTVTTLRFKGHDLSLLLQDAATTSGSHSSLIDTHFMIYYEMSEKGAAIGVDDRRIPHRWKNPQTPPEGCESPFDVDCSSLYDSVVAKLAEGLKQEERDLLAMLFAKLTANEDAMANGAGTTCAVAGPPLCPQALLQP